jgi:hypothetical protein
MAKGHLETKSVGIDDVQPHPKNVRQGDIGAISESLKAHGQYRAIVVQKSTGHILAGNHTWKAAKALGWQNIEAHMLDCDDDRAMRIMLADNRANDLASYDDAALAELLKELDATELGLDGTMFDGDALDSLLYDLEQNATNPLSDEYTQTINIPQYQIVGEQPAAQELCNTEKYQTLLNSIDKAELADDVKRFLRLAAARHIVFDYRKIAEFYPHASAEVQQLIEDSALVIVDANDAIRNGYALLEQTLTDLRVRDDDSE